MRLNGRLISSRNIVTKLETCRKNVAARNQLSIRATPITPKFLLDILYKTPQCSASFYITVQQF